MKVYPFGAPDAIDVSGAVDRAGHAHCGREGGAMKDTYLAKDFRATAARRVSRAGGRTECRLRRTAAGPAGR